MISKYCRKASFCDEKQALIFIEKLNKTAKNKKQPQTAYLCSDCLNWHLTSSDWVEIKDEEPFGSLKEYKKEIVRLNNKINKLFLLTITTLKNL
jgi:hypothetical protein